jgi:hypothetical protein
MAWEFENVCPECDMPNELEEEVCIFCGADLED